MLQNAITTSTRNWLGRFFLLAGAIAGVLACEEPKEIGLPPSTPVDVLYSDTITVVRETLRFDSTRSNDQSNLMVGRYTDPVFGRVQARAYVQSVLASDFVVNDTITSNVTASSRIIHDSTRLVLDLEGFYYGDTTQTQEIQVSRLTDTLNTRINYDIRSTVGVAAQPIARQTIRARPTARDSVNARFVLPESYGREILALANTDAGKLANGAAFRAQFRSGLQISANTSDRAAILSYLPGYTASGFVYGSYVVVYYHVEGEKSRRQQFLFLNGKRFNQITADRGGTALSGLQTGQVLSAAATNGRTFVQPATGVTTKLTFPTLATVIGAGRVAINRADLIITPTASGDASIYTPPLLALGEVDEQNHLRRTPTNTYPYLVPNGGLLSRDPSTFVNVQEVGRVALTNTYTFNIGGYMQSIVSKLTPNTGLVLLTPGGTLFQQSQSGALSDVSQQVLTDRAWRMVLDKNTSVKLVIFYTTSK